MISRKFKLQSRISSVEYKLGETVRYVNIGWENIQEREEGRKERNKA